MRGGGSTTYNMPEIAAELEEAPANRAIGTTLWFETSMFRSGGPPRACTACPFHGHAQTYRWTCIVIEPSEIQRIVETLGRALTECTADRTTERRT
jgi:hypothetical protein